MFLLIMTTNPINTSLLEHLAGVFKDATVVRTSQSAIEGQLSESYQIGGVFSGSELRKVAIATAKFMNLGKDVEARSYGIRATPGTYDISYVENGKGHVIVTTGNSEGIQLSIDQF